MAGHYRIDYRAESRVVTGIAHRAIDKVGRFWVYRRPLRLPLFTALPCAKAMELQCPKRASLTRGF